MISPTEKFTHGGQTFVKEFLKKRQVWHPTSNFNNKNNIIYNSNFSIRISLFGNSFLHYLDHIYGCHPRMRKPLEHCWLWIKLYESSACIYWWRPTRTCHSRCNLCGGIDKNCHWIKCHRPYLNLVHSYKLKIDCIETKWDYHIVDHNDTETDSINAKLWCFWLTIHLILPTLCRILMTYWCPTQRLILVLKYVTIFGAIFRYHMQ